MRVWSHGQQRAALFCSAKTEPAEQASATGFLLQTKPTQLLLPLFFLQRLRCHPKNKRECKKETIN